MDPEVCNKADTIPGNGGTLTYSSNCGPETWIIVMAIILVLLVLAGVAGCLYRKKNNNNMLQRPKVGGANYS